MVGVCTGSGTGYGDGGALNEQSRGAARAITVGERKKLNIDPFGAARGARPFFSGRKRSERDGKNEIRKKKLFDKTQSKTRGHLAFTF